MELKESHIDLIDYLKAHEEDISMGINDLDSLTDVFLEVFGHMPLGAATKHQQDYESVELEVATGEPDEFGIFYKGGQISMDEIVLRLNRLSHLEKQNDDISMLVLNWTEKVCDTYVGDQYEWVEGYHAGINECRENISEIWKENR